MHTEWSRRHDAHQGESFGGDLGPEGSQPGTTRTTDRRVRTPRPLKRTTGREWLALVLATLLALTTAVVAEQRVANPADPALTAPTADRADAAFEPAIDGAPAPSVAAPPVASDDATAPRPSIPPIEATSGSLSATFLGGAASFATARDGDARPIRLTTRSIGGFVPGTPTVVEADGEVHHRWAGVTEWFRPVNDGFEHGYTIDRPLADGDRLEITVDVANAQVRSDGADVMFVRGDAPTVWYRGLHVFDATGRTLEASMTPVAGTIEFAIDTADAVYPITVDPVLSEFQVIRAGASVGIADERFGAAVDIVGNRMVASAPAADAGAESAGLVRVLDRPDASSPWAVTAEIVSPSPESFGLFGDAIALSPDGTRIAVGESDRLGDLAEPGRVFVFELQEGVWSLLAGPVAVTPAAGPDGFGASVAWAGNDRLVIGAPFTGGTGAVFDYTVGGALTPISVPFLGVSAGDEFGFSVAVDVRPEGGHRLIVGAPGWTGSDGGGGLFPDIGGVYVFDDVSGTGFVQRNFLVTEGLGPPVRFGESVAVSGNRWAAGSSGGASITGTLYRTEDGGESWIGETTVSVPKALGTPALANRYVAVEGGTLALGVPGGGGSVALFRTNGSSSGGAWPITPSATLQPSGVDPGDLFGWSIALDRGTLVAGAPDDDGADNTALQSGAVYAASVPIVATFTSAVDSNWTNPANWDVGVVPGVGDFAIVPQGTTAVFDSLPASVGRIRVRGELQVSGGADLTIDGSYGGSSIVDAGGLLRVFSPSALRLTGEFVVEGGGQVTTQEDLGSGPGVIRVQGGLNIGGGGLIANSGLVQKIGGGALFVGESIVWNSGTNSELFVTEGDANVLTSQFDAQGRITVAPGSTLRLAGNLDLAPTSRLGFGVRGPSDQATNYGRIVLPTGYVVPDGTVAIDFFDEYDIGADDSYPVIACLAASCNDGVGSFTEYETFSGSRVLDMVRSFEGWNLEVVPNKVIAGDPGATDFGFSVDVDGDVAVVGEPNRSGVPGRVHILERDTVTGGWAQVFTFFDSGAAVYGESVAIDGEFFAATTRSTGVVRVYRTTGGPGSFGLFGTVPGPGPGAPSSSNYLAIDNGILLVGRPDLSTPRVDVYALSGLGVEPAATLAPAGGAVVPSFGASVAIRDLGSGDAVAAIGAPSADGSGQAFVFKRSSGSWDATPSDVLAPAAPDNDPDDRFFGNAIAVSGDTLVVGQWFNSTAEFDSGAAFVYEGSPGAWAAPQKLQASNGGGGDTFGSAVDIDGDVIVVGAGAAQKPDFAFRDGAAYVFERVGGTWSEREILRAADGANQERFGDALAISDGNLLVGAPQDTNANGPGAGAVYSYSVDQPAPPPPADPFVVTTTASDGPGSLRAAIAAANAVSVIDEPNPITISFDIAGAGPHTIAPATLLPQITRPVVIDGYTQPGSSPNSNPLWDASNAVIAIEVSGASISSAIPGNVGLNLGAGSDGSTVRGLAVNRFGGTNASGIAVSGSTGVAVQGNILGLGPDGSVVGAPVQSIGVFVGNSTATQIGGTAPAHRNVITGNSVGIWFAAAGAADGVVEGNYLGTDPSGTIALGTGTAGGSGLEIRGQRTRIGGVDPGAGNLISGHRLGINIPAVATSATDTVIQGNRIGTDRTGTVILGNGTGGSNHGGVIVLAGSGARIGGTTPSASNLIRGSNPDGVLVASPASQTSVLGNSISDSAGLGIRLASIDAPVPVITDVVLDMDAAALFVSGELTGPPDVYRIEVFANDVCNASGAGEGQYPLTSVTIDPSDFASDVATFTAPVFEPLYITAITATATNSAGTTSAFAGCGDIVVVPLEAVDDDAVTAVGTTVTIDVLANDVGGSPFGWIEIDSFVPAPEAGTLTLCTFFRTCSFSAEATGEYTFSYTLRDTATGETSSATVTVDVRDEFGSADFGTATIDGVIDPAEWAAADRIDLSYLVGDSLEPMSMYVMNDAQYLYAAFDTRGNGLPEALLVRLEGTDSFGVELGDTDWEGRFSIDGFAVDDVAGTVELRRALDTGIDGGVVVNLPDSLAFEVLEGFGLDNLSIRLPDVGAPTEPRWSVTPGAPIGPPDGTIVPDSGAAVTGTAAPGGYRVRLTDVPSDQLLGGAEAIVGAPLQAVGLQASPLGAIPLRAIPLRAIARADTTVLADLPIDGGWTTVLADTPLAGLPLQTVTLGEALDALEAFPERLAALSLADLTTTGTPLGATDLSDLLIDLTLVDEDKLEGGLAATPLGAIPLRAIPLRAIPLGAIPLRSIPLGAIPLGAIPLRTIDVTGTPLAAIPLRAIGDLAATPLRTIDANGASIASAPLGAIPLGAIPLGAIPLGAIPLRTIPLGAIPLRSIDLTGLADSFCQLHDADAALDPDLATCLELGIDPDTTTILDYLRILGQDGAGGSLEATPLRSIPLGAIPLGAIPLGAIDLSSVPLGAIPLGAIPLRSIPLGAIPLGAIPLGAIPFADVCAAVIDGTSCTEDLLLADYLAATGASSLESTPLAAIPLAAIPLGAIPLRSIPLESIRIADVPLGAIPLRAIDLQSSPLGAIPLGAIDGSLETTPLRAIPLAAIAELELADLMAYFNKTDSPEFTLNDVLDHLTIAFFDLLGDEFGGLTFGELLVSLLLATDFPWEDLPLDLVDLRAAACGTFALPGFSCTAPGGPSALRVNVPFQVTDDTVSGSSLRIAAPSDWVPAPDGTYLSAGGSIVTVYDTLRRQGGDWVMDLPPLPVGSYEIDVALMAPLRLGDAGIISSVRFESRSGATTSAVPGPISLSVIAPTGTPDQSSPLGIEDDALYVGYVDAPGRQDWYQIPAPGPGFRVAVYLSNLDGDLDTFVYRPDTAPPLGDPEAVRAIPLGSTPVDDGGVNPDGSTVLSPEPLADTAADPTLTLVAASTNRGSTSEETVFFSRVGDGTEPYLIQVAGYGPATSTSPYVLRVRYEPVVAPTAIGACPARPTALTRLTAGDTRPEPTVPPGTTALFLTNPTRLASLYADDALDVGASDVDTALQTLLDSSDVDVNGVVVDIAAIPDVAEAFNSWDAEPCSPDLANRVAGLIQAWIQATVADVQSIRHVAIIGSDEVIPFARLQDSTVVANESTYVDDFRVGTALHGSQSARTYLSDSPYGDLDPIPWLDRYAYLPELGVGRLVESPAQIVGAIETFLAEGGVLSPGTAAVAGYDFLTDGAEEVKRNLASIVNDQGASTITDVDPNGALLARNWTRDQLRAIGFGGASGTAPDIISANAHYDHYRSLPAIGDLNKDESDLFTITDVDELLAGPVDLVNRILFTMGCHGGLNVPAGTAVDGALDRDWAEVYSAARAIYVGNTGYGYGDTATVALTEQLMANFAFHLDGSRTIGQALSQAKQDQFGKAGIYGVYDLKAIEQVTLYGLPMWEIDGPGRPAGASPISNPYLEPITGLQAASFGIEPALTETTTPQGSFWSADGETQFLHWRPIQPKTSIDVSKDGLLATGVLLTELTSTDQDGVDAVFGRPIATSATGRNPEIESRDVVFPTSFATLGTSSRTNTGPGAPSITQQNVNLITGQYDGTGTVPVQRLFRSMDGVVHYVGAGSDLAGIDWTPPRILRTDADANADTNAVRFEVDTSETAVRVVVLYRSSESGGVSRWRALDLDRQGATDTWAGTGAFGNLTPPLDYLVQAVNADGVVGVSTSKGQLYRAEAGDPSDPGGGGEDPAAPILGLVTCNGAGCTAAAYDGDVTVTAADGVLIRIGAAAPVSSVTLTEPGFTLLTLVRGDETATLLIQIVGPDIPDPPLVEVITCNDDACEGEYEGPVTLAVPPGVSIQVGDGDPVPGPVTVSEPGTYSVTLRRGTETAVLMITVLPEPGIRFEGFFSPLATDVDPLDPRIVNLVKAGQAVPLKWRLYAPDGSLITSTAGIQVNLRLYDCAAEPAASMSEVDPVPSVGNGLRFSDDQFQFNMKTVKSWRGQCAAVRVLVEGEIVGMARFQFR